MSRLGMKIILNELSGAYADSIKIFRSMIGKTIANLEIKDDALIFTFEDKARMSLFDDGQTCCESRWMETDDDLTYYIGAVLRDGAIKDGPTEENEYGEMSESQFLVITTSKGQFTIANYNEHNGYYGGFCIRALDLNANN